MFFIRVNIRGLAAREVLPENVQGIESLDNRIAVLDTAFGRVY